MGVSVSNLNIKGRTVIGVNPTIVTNGLIMYLDAGNRSSYPTSGTTWTDLSGNGNNGTLTNGPTFNSANQGSIAFDGSNDYVLLNNFSSIITTNFTYVGWVYIGTIQNDINVIIGNRAGGTEDGFFFAINGYLNSNRSLYVETYTAAASYGGGGYPSNTIKDNSWNFVAFAADRTNSRGYVYHNDNNIRVITIPSFQLNVRNWRIGLATGGIFGLKGNVPIAMLYNRVLSDEEIYKNYYALKNRYI